MTISRAPLEAAEAILALQKLAYQSEARLYNDDSIPPLRQTIDELRAEFATNVILQAEEGNALVGSVRALQQGNSCLIGRLIVHPDWQGRGIGTSLMHAIEAAYPRVRRFELFTGTRSEGNIRLYQRLGYQIFKTVIINPQLELVYLEKRTD